MKETGSATAGQRLLGGTQRRQIASRSRAKLEEHALCLRQAENGWHGVLHRVDKAGRALRLVFDTHVEPNRRIEAGHLVQKDVCQLGMEGLGIFVSREVTVFPAPFGHGVRYPVDELADAGFAPVGPQLAPEVLAHNDVRGGLRPGLRNLYVVLLENHIAFLIADTGVTQFPFDSVIRVDIRRREDTIELQSDLLLSDACLLATAPNAQHRTLLLSATRFRTYRHFQAPCP
jgi:hypothetical protein